MLKTLFGKSATQTAPEASSASPANAQALPPSLGFVSHQAVFDGKQQLVAYEFSPRDSLHRHDSHYDQLILQTLTNLDIFRLLSHRRAFVNLSLSALSNPLLATLATHRAICILNPGAHPVLDDALIERVRTLRASGLAFALEPALYPEYQHDAACLQQLFAQMDYLVLDFSVAADEVLAPLLDKLPQRYPHMRWYARQVNSMEAYEVCRKSAVANERFVLFNGPYLTHFQPGNADATPTDSGQLRVMEILRLLRAGADNKALEAQFKLDSVLLFKLLRFINSPANGLNQQIKTLDETLLLLGRESLFKWLTLLLFTNHKGSARNLTLLECALWRAHFMESLGRARGKNRLECEHLFLTGMFSTLDALLHLPIAQALAPLALPATVSSALIDCNGLFAPYLALTLSLEQAQAARIAALSNTLGLGASEVNRLQIEAMAWAQNISAQER